MTTPATQAGEIQEVRVGRNFIRVGDIVRVTPSSPGRRDGFLAKVTGMRRTADGLEFNLFGAPKGRPVAARTMRAGRIQRVAQTRHQGPANR